MDVGGLLVSCLAASLAGFHRLWLALLIPAVLNGGSAGVSALVWGLAYTPPLLAIVFAAARRWTWRSVLLALPVLALPLLGLTHLLGETPLAFQESCLSCKWNLKNLGTALESYALEHQGQYPPNLQTLCPKYLKVPIECLPGKPTWLGARLYDLQGIEFSPYAYTVRPDGKRCQICCQTGKHTWTKQPKGWPAYDSVEGLCERQPLPDIESPIPSPKGDP